MKKNMTSYDPVACAWKKYVDKVYAVCMCLHVRSVQLDVLKSKWKRYESYEYYKLS
jgi:hypothetical protein